MSTHNRLANLISAISVTGQPWTINGNQILCDNTPVFDMPDDSEDPAMRLRNDLLRELVRITNDYSLTEKVASHVIGPWILKDSYLLFNNIGLAAMCDPASERIPFQKAAARLFVSLANLVTPKQYNFEYTLEPSVSPYGYSSEESNAIQRTVVVSQDLQVINIEHVQQGDIVYESVYSKLHDHVVIKSYMFEMDSLDVEPAILTTDQYKELVETSPDVVELLRFHDLTDAPVFVSDKPNTFSIIS